MDSDIDNILCAARRSVEARGVCCASYRLVPSFHSQLDPSALLFHFGFPSGWVALYDHDPEFRRHDPIADFVIRAGRPMKWSDAIAAQKLTPGQAHFSRKMNELGLQHGVALPVYGPHGREAYVTFSLGREMGMSDEPLIEDLAAYAAKIHRQIVLAIDGGSDTFPRFSQRETEVLGWIARGKSNADIATILEVSEGTVGTYVSRVFRKLGVHSRMSATLMGLKYGLVRL